jgi:hypothetical protein
VHYSKTGEFEEGIKPDEGTWTREGTSLSLFFFAHLFTRISRSVFTH